MPSTTTTTFEKTVIENSNLSNNLCSACSISTTVVEQSAKKIKISNDTKLKNSDNNNDNNDDDDNNDEDIEICHHKIELIDDSNDNQVLVDDHVEKNNDSVEYSLKKFQSRLKMLKKEELLDIEALRVSVLVSSVFSAIEKDHLCRILNFKRAIYMFLIYNCKKNVVTQLDCKCMDFFNIPFCVCLETIGNFFKTLEIEIKECYTKERIKSFFFDRDSFQKDFIETAIQLGLLKETTFYQTTTETNNNNNDDDNHIEQNNSLLVTNSSSNLFDNKNEIYLQRMKGYFDLFPFFYKEDIRKTIIESVEKEKVKSLINIVSSEELSCSKDTTSTPTTVENYFADAQYNVVLDIDGVLLVNVLGDNIDHGMYDNNYLGNINSKKLLQIFLLSTRQLITQRFAHGVFELLYYLWTNKNVKSIAIFSSGIEDRNEVVADYIFSQMPPIRKKRDFILRSRHHLFSKKPNLCTQKILSNYTPQPLLSSSIIKSTNSISSDLSGFEKNYKHNDSSTLTSLSSFTSSSAVSTTDNTITTIETETTTTETTITATTEELCRKISERYSEIAKLGGNEFSVNNGFPKKQQEQFSTVMASNIFVKELSRNFPSFDLQNTILIDDQKDNSQIGEINNMIVVPNVESGSFVKHVHAETNSAMYICGIIDHLFKKAQENAKPLTDIVPTVESDVFNYDFYSQGLQILRKINPDLEFLNQNNYEKQAKLFYLPTFINDNKTTVSTSSSTNHQTNNNNNNTVSCEQNVLKIVENIMITSNNDDDTDNKNNNNDNNLTKTIQVM